MVISIYQRNRLHLLILHSNILPGAIVLVRLTLQLVMVVQVLEADAGVVILEPAHLTVHCS